MSPRLLVPANLVGVRAEVAADLRRRIATYLAGEAWQPFSDEFLPVRGLILLAGPFPELDLEPHVHAYLPFKLLVDEVVHGITGHVLHVPPYAKFAGILLIIMTALLYTADGAVRRAVRPLVHVATPVMRGVTLAVSLVMWPLTRAVQMLLSAQTRARE